MKGSTPGPERIEITKEAYEDMKAVAESIIAHQNDWVKLIVPGAEGPPARPEIGNLVIYPAYMMLALAVTNDDLLDEYVAGGIPHAWGRQVPLGVLRKVAADVRAGLEADPNRCTDDGIEYPEESKTTRDYLLGLCDMITGFQADDALIVTWLFNEQTICDCDACRGSKPVDYHPGVSDIHQDFMDSWNGFPH